MGGIVYGGNESIDTTQVIVPRDRGRKEKNQFVEKRTS